MGPAEIRLGASARRLQSARARALRHRSGPAHAGADNSSIGWDASFIRQPGRWRRYRPGCWPRPTRSWPGRWKRVLDARRSAGLPRRSGTGTRRPVSRRRCAWASRSTTGTSASVGDNQVPLGAQPPPSNWSRSAQAWRVSRGCPLFGRGAHPAQVLASTSAPTRWACTGRVRWSWRCGCSTGSVALAAAEAVCSPVLFEGDGGPGLRDPLAAGDLSACALHLRPLLQALVGEQPPVRRIHGPVRRPAPCGRAGRRCA